MKQLARKWGARSVGIIVWACLLLALSAEPPIRAQPQSPKDKKAAGTADSPANVAAEGKRKPAPEAATSSPGKLEYVPVPAPLLQKMQQLWDRQRQADPEYNVTSVTLAGRADDQRAELTVTLKVKINRENQWVLVPLRLNEANLRDDPKYAGAGEERPGVNDGLDRETGYLWWFKGKGLHELTLPIFVTVQKQVPSRRLQLSLPAAAFSHLELQVPLQRLRVTVPEDVSRTVRPAGEAGSEIELYGLGKRLDLAWLPIPIPSPVEPVLQATTLMTVELTGESVLMTARQTIQALPGSLSEVGVHLPAGFELLDVNGNQYGDHQQNAQDPRHVIVKLTEPSTRPVELTWTLESPFPQKGQPLSLEGFQVDNARSQTGRIGIITPEGYRISKRDGENVYRSNVSRPVQTGSLTAGGARMESAYQFLKQPFHLVLDVREIEPYYTVEPILLLKLSGDRADLAARFRFDVVEDRGPVREIDLHWPTSKDEGWVIEPLELPGLVEQVQFDNGNRQGTIRVRLVVPKTGRFELPLKASRKIVAGEKQNDFSLPTATASSRLPTILSVFDADNVESHIEPRGKTSSRPLSARRRLKVELPEEFRELRRSDLSVDSQAHEFSAKVSVHEQHIETATTATVQLQEDRLLVTQRIHYQVGYERLSQVRLMVPQELADRVKFYSADDAQLSASWSEVPPDWSELQPNWTLEVGTSRQARLMLTKQRLGEFDVVSRFLVELPEELPPQGEMQLRLPLIQSADAEFSTARFELKPSGPVRITVAEGAWKKQLSVDDWAVWIAAESQPEIPLRIQRSTTDPSQDYAVRKALIRTVFDVDGHASSRAQYRIVGDVSTIVMNFPPDMTWEDIWWNGKELQASQVQQNMPGSGEYRLSVAKVPGDVDHGEHLLSVAFHSNSASRFFLSESHQLTGPWFPPNVWVEQTLWEVTLPRDQHLLTNPHGFTPAYRWQRDGIFWVRRPRPQFADLSAWISADAVPDEFADFKTGNAYQFSRFGPSTVLQFRSMSQPVVRLIGAGLALAAGIVLLKIPATRNVLTVLIVAFVLAGVGVLYTAPLQLLLQPAVLGLLLAIALAMIESYFRRRRTATILTLSSPSDFLSPASTSSVERAIPVGVGSEELTAVRPTRPSAVEPVSASESGSGA